MRRAKIGCRFVHAIGPLLGGLLFLTCPPWAVGAKPDKQVRPTLEQLLKQLGFGVIPMERNEQNHLYVEARFGGKKRLLSVDTACTMTTLDKSVAKNLKTLKQLGASLKDPNLGVFDDPSIVMIEVLELGSIRLLNQPAGVMSLGLTFEHGILGCDFLMRHWCLIDCMDRRLYVRGSALKADAQDVLERSLSQSGYHCARLSRTKALALTCDAKINAVPVKLLVDTGAPFTILDDEPAKRCGLSLDKTGAYVRGPGKIGDSRLLAARPKSLEIDGGELPSGDFAIGGAELARWDIGEKQSPLENVDGCLGAELLAMTGALIDFPHRKIWFAPPPPSDKSDKAAPKKP